MFGRGTVHGILMSGGMGLLVLGAGWVWAADQAPAVALADAEIAAALDETDAEVYEIEVDADFLGDAFTAAALGGDLAVYDIAPCGGNDTVDVDDLLAMLDAFAGVYACNCPGGAGLWEASGVNIYNTNTGNVDVGTTITLDPADAAGAGFITLRMLDGGAVLRNTVSIEAEEGGGGGQILLRNETATTRLQMDGDGAEDEGFIQIFNGAGTATILLDGQDTTGNGLVQTQRIEVTGSGDASVDLPNSSVSAAETLNEPGIASATGGALELPNTSESITLTSRSITVPSSGYLFAMATVQFEVVNSGGANVFFAITTDSTDSAVGAPDHGFWNPNLDSFHTASIQRVIPVSAGVHTLYLRGAESGETDVDLSRLTILFLPTAYGTVTP